MRRIFFAVLLLSYCIPVAAKAEYTPGFIWERSTDYDEGTVHGSSLGNPNTDSEGNGVWQYEFTSVAGDPLGSATPWYQGATNLCVWDSNWPGGYKAWARGDDESPVFSSGQFIHESTQNEFDYVPIERWLNPVSSPFLMDISGNLILWWQGEQNSALPTDVDVALVQWDDSKSSYMPLYTSTFSKPTNDNSWEELPFNIDIDQVLVQPSDEIILSIRARDSSTSVYPLWITLVDDGLTFTVASEPFPNMIQNGSFEYGLYDDGITELPGVIDHNTGDPRLVFVPPTSSDPIYVLRDGATAIKDWVTSSVAPKTIDWVQTDTLAASDGDHVVDLNGTPGPGGIGQTFDTIPGKEYEVVFDMAGNPDTLEPPQGPIADPIKLLQVSAAGQSKEFSFDASSTTTMDMGWETKSWIFVANGTSTTLEFLSLTPTYEGATPANEYIDFGPVIDNVAAYESYYSADFDEDGDVDGADFLQWQRHSGTASIPAFSGSDATGDGNVDAADLAIWQAQFGSRSASSSMATVPEPTSFFLSLFGFTVLGWFRRHMAGRTVANYCRL